VGEVIEENKGTSIYSDFEHRGERRGCKFRFFHGVGCSSAIRFVRVFG
jgi:hypothetical protein